MATHAETPDGHCRDSAGGALAIQLAGLVLTEKLMTFAAPPEVDEVRLTDRERVVLAWVAEGKSDWEIGVILGLAETTVRFHADNGRKKLGAVNRAQAVARLAAARLIQGKSRGQTKP